MSRYFIVQASDARWIIVNADDPGLVWAGSHWCDPDQRAAHPLTFSSKSAAVEYAQTILGR